MSGLGFTRLVSGICCCRESGDGFERVDVVEGKEEEEEGEGGEGNHCRGSIRRQRLPHLARHTLPRPVLVVMNWAMVTAFGSS